MDEIKGQGPSVGSVTEVARSTDSEIARWLACASQPPEAGSPLHGPGADQVRNEWADSGIALLPCGRRFCAVRLPARLMHAAAGTDLTEIVTATLLSLAGPVFIDTYNRIYYALVPVLPRSVWPWDRDQVPLLGDGAYVGVPRPDRLQPPGSHWVMLPRTGGDLCAVSAVDTLIRWGLRELGRGEQS